MAFDGQNKFWPKSGPGFEKPDCKQHSVAYQGVDRKSSTVVSVRAILSHWRRAAPCGPPQTRQVTWRHKSPSRSRTRQRSNWCRQCCGWWPSCKPPLQIGCFVGLPAWASRRVPAAAQTSYGREGRWGWNCWDVGGVQVSHARLKGVGGRVLPAWIPRSPQQMLSVLASHVLWSANARIPQYAGIVGYHDPNLTEKNHLR